MNKLCIGDSRKWFSIEIKVANHHLAEALRHEDAEDVIFLSTVGALTSLTNSGVWPQHLMRLVRDFLVEQKHAVVDEQLM
jgi:hypothetical protein